MPYNFGTGIQGGLGGAASGFSVGGPIGAAIGGGLGLLGGFMGSDQSPTDAANDYYKQIPGQTLPYFKPYFDAGTGAIPTLQGQYSNLLNDPTGMMNKIGAGYKQSPGYNYELQQALAGSDRAAAAGGYSGLPQHSAEGMEAAQGLASKDFNQYLQNALSQYGLGLQGEQGLYQGGISAGTNMASILAQALAQQGNLAFKGASDENAGATGFLSSLPGVLGNFFGGDNTGAGAGVAEGVKSGINLSPKY